LRWWDGNAWTFHASQVTAPAGWYPSPDGTGPRRWWDGHRWDADALEASASEPQPTFAAAAAVPAVVGVALSVIIGRILESVTFDHLGHSPTVAIAAFYCSIYGGLALTCILTSRQFGTGSLVRDFGWRFRIGDLWRGGLVFMGCAVAANAVAIITIVALGLEDASERANELFHYGLDHLPLSSLLVLALAAVVAAPLLEELTFRGLLQRTFTARVGIWPAVVLQAALFGAFHFDQSAGLLNVPAIVSRAVVGIGFGLAVMRWRRLGVSMVAHTLSNTIVVIAVAATR
jgi:membrane protease YdiL (CAAX protease family)